MRPTVTRDELKTIATSSGASLVGFVDLSTEADKLSGYGFEFNQKMPTAISVGMALLDSIVDQLGPITPPSVAKLYRSFCYDLVNSKLDEIAFTIASILERSGFDALPIPASPLLAENRTLFGLFSHKVAARLCGLGWIGPSCLLVTPEYGPRIRWATVLTNAPIGGAPHPVEIRCGTCSLCVESCPARAFTGREFDEQEPRESRMDPMKCHEHLVKMEQEKGVRVCGRCVAVCPYGARPLT